MRQGCGGGGLHRAIGDDPESEEAADQEEGGAASVGRAVGKDGLEIDGDAHDEPDIAGAEEEQPGEREAVDAGVG